MSNTDVASRETMTTVHRRHRSIAMEIYPRHLPSRDRRRATRDATHTRINHPRSIDRPRSAIASPRHRITNHESFATYRDEAHRFTTRRGVHIGVRILRGRAHRDSRRALGDARSLRRHDRGGGGRRDRVHRTFVGGDKCGSRAISRSIRVIDR